ncbi:MAG: hypothetical protein GXP31_11125 [Kiritimatiellaeota bacterium]|nr:hypothetical protein [Kiritimatiellota bacterium]
MKARRRLFFVSLLGLCSVVPAFSLLAAGGKTPEKVRKLVVPRLKFEDATIQQVVQFLQQQSKRLDPDGEGVNFLLELDRRVTAAARPKIPLDLRSLPLSEAIRYVCMAAGLQYKIEDYAVIIADRGVPLGKMETRFYPVEPGVIGSFRTRKRFKALKHGDNGGGGGNGGGNGGR